MEKSVLSQQEIDALLKDSKSSHSNYESDLASVLRSFNRRLVVALEVLTQHSLDVEGSYLEPVSDDTRPFTEPMSVVVVELGLGDTFLTISQSSSQALADAIGSSVERALALVVDRYVSTLASFLSERQGKLVSGSFRGPIDLSPAQARSLRPASQSYLATTELSWGGYRSSLVLVLSAAAAERVLLPPKHTPKQSPKRRDLSVVSALTPIAQEIEVEVAQFAELSDGDHTSSGQDIELVRDVEISVFCELGRSEMTLGQLMELQVGDVITIDKTAGDPAELYVNHHAIARAEVTVLDENFGVRILDIVPKVNRIYNK